MRINLRNASEVHTNFLGTNSWNYQPLYPYSQPAIFRKAWITAEGGIGHRMHGETPVYLVPYLSTKKDLVLVAVTFHIPKIHYIYKKNSTIFSWAIKTVKNKAHLVSNILYMIIFFLVFVKQQNLVNCNTFCNWCRCPHSPSPPKIISYNFSSHIIYKLHRHITWNTFSLFLLFVFLNESLILTVFYELSTNIEWHEHKNNVKRGY